MMTKKPTLTCVFQDNLGGLNLLDINDPKEGLTSAEIARFMENIIEADIFVRSEAGEEVYLTSIIGAAYTHKLAEFDEF